MEKKRKHNFTIEERDGVFHLLDNGEQAMTPGDTPVTTKSEKLAKILVKSGNATDGSYTKPSDILCYHYSVLDFYTQCTEEDRQDMIDFMVSLIAQGNDPFLMFRQMCPAWIAIAKRFEEMLSNALPTLPLHRLMCFIVLTTSLQSPMLAHYIFSDIIAEEGDYKDLKDDFLDDLKEYCAEKGFRYNRRRFSSIIDTFVSYFTLDEI